MTSILSSYTGSSRLKIYINTVWLQNGIYYFWKDGRFAKQHRALHTLEYSYMRKRRRREVGSLGPEIFEGRNKIHRENKEISFNEEEGGSLQRLFHELGLTEWEWFKSTDTL